jgi:hypothetical protein
MMHAIEMASCGMMYLTKFQEDWSRRSSLSNLNAFNVGTADGRDL